MTILKHSSHTHFWILMSPSNPWPHPLRALQAAQIIEVPITGGSVTGRLDYQLKCPGQWDARVYFGMEPSPFSRKWKGLLVHTVHTFLWKVNYWSMGEDAVLWAHAQNSVYQAHIWIRPRYEARVNSPTLGVSLHVSGSRLDQEFTSQLFLLLYQISVFCRLWLILINWGSKFCSWYDQ